jgi:hypothetical protein
MIFQFIVDSLLDLVLFVVNLIPEASPCILDGVDQAIGWFAYIYSASMYIVPWSDIFFMLGITLTIAIGQIAVQSIAYLRR